MNRPLRRAAVAVGLLFVLLIANATRLQVFQADALREDDGNTRVLLSEYERQRGSIVADGQAIAQSVATDDRLKYLRTYSNGPVYAPVTGYYSLVYGANGMEQVENELLNGDDDRLFQSKIADLFTGRDRKGGNVVLTINRQAQEAAYNALGGRTGSVVALDPKTGEILAMVSTPSYDPNTLSSHMPSEIRNTRAALLDDPQRPLVNRAISERYPPGSTFKVVISAAALQNGYGPESVIPAPTDYILPGTNTRLPNFGGGSCGANDQTTLTHALTISCNTAFADLGIQLGADEIRQQAAAFGIDDQNMTVPLRVAPSTVGPLSDRAAIGQSSIGQNSVAITPLEASMIASAIANDGMLMRPHLVKEAQSPRLDSLDTTDPEELRRTMPKDVARDLQDMMTDVVNNGSGRAAQIPGVTVAGKTGTAQNQEGMPPHAWFIGFAPADNPRVAVAVLLENADSSREEATGGRLAAPIAKTVMEAVLASQEDD